MSDSTSTSDRRRVSPRRIRWVAFVALAAAVGLATLGILSRVHDDHALKNKADTDAAPMVSLVDQRQENSQQQLVLPGNVQAYFDAPIYARVPGYLKKWYFDIGASVKAGDVLAEIETPEVDQQLAQAQADLATAQAKERLAKLTAKRWDDMLASESVSKQETDEKNGDYEAKAAATTAAKANVDRLQALASFKRIIVPFDGVVTARKTDIGALINAGSSSGGELFRVADTRKLRVYVNVPQAYSDQVSKGMTAQLVFPEKPGKTFPAIIVSTSESINESSRTLLVQLEADNAQGKLVSGSYADVHFDLPAVKGIVQLPVTALLFRQNGLKVATVGADNRVVLKKIQLGRDFGTRVEVIAGLDPTDRVIDSPPDWLAQGDSVRVSPAEPEKLPSQKAVATANP